MKILIVNATKLGGAAVAVNRLETQLTREGLEVKRVTVNNYGKGKIASVIFLVEQLFLRVLRVDKGIFYSPALFSIGINDEIKEFNPDIVHLHWINGALLKPEDLAEFNKPTVWTMHDMWPFCGAEHHSNDNKYKEGYKSESKFSLNRWLWERKTKTYQKIKKMVFVSPSRWLKKKAEQSCLTEGREIVYLPNGIDLKKYYPEDKKVAKSKLGLKPDVLVVLVGAAFANGDKNKNINLAVKILSKIKKDIVVVAVGKGDKDKVKKVFEKSGKRLLYLGYIDDEDRMREIYSASDVFLMCSKNENLPNMAIESMACGTSVVAFDVGGVGEIVDNKVNGFLSSYGDINDVVKNLNMLLTFSSKQKIEFYSNSRKKIVQNYDLKKTTKQVIEVYKKLIS
ncbi:MAG: glycosyltransferase [Candidatus Shapirobacteria bacterium]|jgi:glycosyltransferase involved in cell wall biosynthesis